MTLATTAPLAEYIENGVTLTHTIPFQFLAATDIACSRIANGVETPLILGTHFTVAGGAGLTGSVTKMSGGTLGTVFRIKRRTTRGQPTDYTQGDAFPAEVHEAALDRLAAVNQEQDVRSDDIAARALLTAPGETMPPLPSKTQLVGRYLAGDADGNLAPASGTGNDPNLRTDLSAITGFTLVKHKIAASTAFARSAAAMQRVGGLEGPGDVFHFIDPALDAALLNRTNTADLAPYVQNAINENYQGRLQFIPVRYRLTSPLSVVAPIELGGHSITTKDDSFADPHGGVQLHFDHPGKGIVVDRSSGGFMGFAMRRMATMRTQPEPTAGWAPIDYDWEVEVTGDYDITLDDVLFLNATRGARMSGTDSASAGRLNLLNVRGQFFKKAVEIDGAYDVCRIDQFHAWPFWRDAPDVHAYTFANLNAVALFRCDNPQLSNLFTIFTNASLQFGVGTFGITHKAHLVNADFDNCQFGIAVDPGVDGLTGQFENVTWQGGTGVVGAKALYVRGNNCRLDFGSFEAGGAGQNAIRVEGTGNRLSFGQVRVEGYDLTAASFPAIEVYDGNVVDMAMKPEIKTGVGTLGPSFSATGTIMVQGRLVNALPSLASASTVAIPTDGDTFNVTGTTNINLLSGGVLGRRIRLVFGGVLTLAHSTATSSSVRLNGATGLVTALGTMIVLYHDGIQWREEGRCS